MKSHLRTGKEIIKETQVVDSETGELLDSTVETTKVKYLANSKEDFYLMYSSLLHALQRSKDLKIRVYAYLLENYNSTSVFQIGKPIKEVMAKRYNVKVASISNILTTLKDEGFLFSPSRGLYQLNPRYSFKGSSKERDKHLKALIELGCDKC
jgi:hypothetical protein